MTMPNDKLFRQAMQAGFNGGWAAAHIGLAMMAEKEGNADYGKWLRERALQPDKVEIVEMDAAEMDAAKAAAAGPAPSPDGDTN